MMLPVTVIVSLDVVATRSKSPVIFSPSPALLPWLGWKVISLLVLMLIPASVVISPSALIVAAPPKWKSESFKSTDVVEALPIVVVPFTPALPAKVPICLIV